MNYFRPSNQNISEYSKNTGIIELEPIGSEPV